MLFVLSGFPRKKKSTHVVTPEGAVKVTWDGGSKAVLALGVAQLGVLEAVHLTRSDLGVPLLDLHLHDAVVDGTRVVVGLFENGRPTHASQGGVKGSDSSDANHDGD